MTQQELAVRMGRPLKTINEIINAKKSITQETALELDRVLGVPAHIWTGLEATYQMTLARNRERTFLESQERWLKEFPVRETERRGWIEKTPDTAYRVRVLLQFLGVASFDAWQKQPVAGYRVAAKYSREAMAGWLGAGVLEGNDTETAPYDEDRFTQALSRLRELTAEPPTVWKPLMETLCASAGVAVVFVPELPRSGANGVARWLTPAKALIQMSLCYKWADIFWFSFFHEAAHIRLHQTRDVHIDGIGDADDYEEEADRAAADLLIPRAQWDAFVADPANFKAPSIGAFALDTGVAPGIVVGRLQFEKRVPYSSFVGLKEKYQWTEE